MGANDLSFDMTADPSEFTEAVAEFSARRVISREEAYRLSGDARRRSWWISGVAQMDVANDAHRSIIEAMQKGVPFEEWQKTAGAAIERDWGRKDSARLLLIFRNATSQAYNSGRWEQMGEPHIVAARPYKKLSVVNDLRTSEICQKFISPPVILPESDPWWLTHCPPLHHGCRSGIVTLRMGPAKEQGILKSAPTEQADEGFGLAPNIQEPPKPSERKVPPEPEIVVKMSEKASRDYRTRKPVEIKIPPKHTPEYWEDHYRAKYGAAARQVGHGRAIHERSKVLSEQEARDILDDLRRSGVPGITGKLTRNLDEAIRLRKNGKPVPEYLQATEDAARLLAQHIKLTRARDVPVLAHDPELFYEIKQNEQFWRTFSSAKLPLPEATSFKRYSGPIRSHYNFILDLVNLDNRANGAVAIHEYGHAIECQGQGELVELSRKFIATRTAGESYQLLSKLDPKRKYGSQEVAKPDKFFEAYIGKDCGFQATEMVSTVVGAIAEGKIVEILEKDPDSLYFVLGILSGVLP